MTRSYQMGKRYTDLMAVQGKTSKEAVEIVNAEFKTSLSDITIRGYGAQYKKKVSKAGARTVKEERNEDKTAGPLLAQEPATLVESSAQMPLSEIDQRIRAVAREVFHEMLHDLRNDTNMIRDPEDVPPEPETVKKAGKGRRENRDYQKASVTIDRVLWDLLVEERDRQKVSTGRALDIILWRAFGRPKLSFETPKETDKESDAWSVLHALPPDVDSDD